MINDPRYRHNRDGRDEQVAAVRVILDRMAANPKRVVAAAARTTTKWNACLQRYVEVR